LSEAKGLDCRHFRRFGREKQRRGLLRICLFCHAFIGLSTDKRADAAGVSKRASFGKLSALQALHGPAPAQRSRRRGRLSRATANANGASEGREF